MTVRLTTTLADLQVEVRSHETAVDGVSDLLPAVLAVATAICTAFDQGGRLYAFGNGGSAADAQHLVAELVGRFRRQRRPLPAIALTTDPSVMTALGNDFDFASVFERQVVAHARPNDIVVAFTTSGRSPNVVNGLAAARKQGATTVLIGGGDGGEAAALADHALLSRDDSAARVQEVHLLVLHLVSEVIDSWAGDRMSPVGNQAPARSRGRDGEVGDDS